MSTSISNTTGTKARLTTELIEAINRFDNLISDRNSELQMEILKLKNERLKVKNAKKANPKAIVDESAVETSKKLIQIKRKQVKDLKTKKEIYEYEGIPEPHKRITCREKITKLKKENADLKKNVNMLNQEIATLKLKIGEKQDVIKTAWEIIEYKNNISY